VSEFELHTPPLSANSSVRRQLRPPCVDVEKEAQPHPICRREERSLEKSYALGEKPSYWRAFHGQSPDQNVIANARDCVHTKRMEAHARKERHEIRPRKIVEVNGRVNVRVARLQNAAEQAGEIRYGYANDPAVTEKPRRLAHPFAHIDGVLQHLTHKDRIVGSEALREIFKLCFDRLSRKDCTRDGAFCRRDFHGVNVEPPAYRLRGKETKATPNIEQPSRRTKRGSDRTNDAACVYHRVRCSLFVREHVLRRDRRTTVSSLLAVHACDRLPIGSWVHEGITTGPTAVEAMVVDCPPELNGARTNRTTGNTDRHEFEDGSTPILTYKLERRS
jgi:hypothetical protein